MKTGLVILLCSIGILGIGFGLGSQDKSVPAEILETEAPKQLIVLELFTSQGCSSCPPAESVLTKIASDKRYSDAVIPLAYHVDYWDYLGWKDPFSSTQWTERQANYREAFGGATLYTPQVVVQGQYELVGSNENGIKKRLNDLINSQPQSDLDISIEELTLKDSQIEVDVLAAKRDTSFAEAMMVVSAIFENVESTEVKAGENAGRTLRNNFVVRSLEMKPLYFEAHENEKRIQVSLLLEKEWQHENLGIVSWIQGANSFEIYQADIVKGLVEGEKG